MNQPRLSDFLMLLALSLMWGSSFILIEFALVPFGPITLAALRIVIAALLLWIFARLAGHRLPLDRRTWLLAIAIGFVGVVLPFPLIGWAQQGIESSRAAIIMSFTPLSTLVMAHLLTADEKMTIGRVAGLAIGLAGVAILLGGTSFEDLTTAGPRQFAVLLATIGYAYSSILMRGFSRISPISASAAIMIAAAVMTLPLALLFEPLPTLPIDPMAGIAVLFLGIFSSAVATVVMITLINRVGVTFMSMNNYLVPAIGVIWGAALLNEEITARSGGAFALILSGVALASFAARRRRSQGL